MYSVSCELRTEFIYARTKATEIVSYVEESRPPLWSSGQSSWLQIQRSGFDSRRYKIFWKVWPVNTLPNTRSKRTPWPESVSELYRPRDRRLSAKLVPTFADRWWHVASMTDSHCSILCFPDQSRYFFFQVSPQLHSRGWVDTVPNPLLLKTSGRAGNGTRTSRSVAKNSDH
jgi:hypothetical protein